MAISRKGQNEAKVDMQLFGDAFSDFINGKIKPEEFCKRIGVSRPTLDKHIEKWAMQMVDQIQEGKIYVDGLEWLRLIKKTDITG